MQDEANNQPSKRAQLLRAARLGAVQSLYAVRVAGQSVQGEIDYFRKNGNLVLLQVNEGNDDEEFSPDHPETLYADFDLYRKLLQKTAEAWDEIITKLQALNDEHGKNSFLPLREPLLMCLMGVAVQELKQTKPNLRARIINEYVTLTASFYGDKETGLVNRILEIIAAQENA